MVGTDLLRRRKTGQRETGCLDLPQRASCRKLLGDYKKKVKFYLQKLMLCFSSSYTVFWSVVLLAMEHDGKMAQLLYERCFSRNHRQ